MLWTLSAAYFAIGADASEQTLAAVNLTGPATFAAIMLWGATTAARRNSTLLFLAPFWFRVSSGLYFGLGNLVTYFAAPETVERMMTFYASSPRELFEVNLIVSTAAACTLTGLRCAAVLFRDLGGARVRAGVGTGTLGGAAAILTAVGFLTKYAVLMPWQMGAFGSLVLPGFIISLNLVPPIAIFLCALWAARNGGGQLLLVPFVLFVLEGLSGVLLGNKTGIVMSTLMLVLGMLAARLDWRGALGGGLLMTVVFVLSVPVTDYVRERLRAASTATEFVTLDQRLGYIREYYRSDSLEADSGVQGAFVRLSYANQTTFAVSQYAAGLPGDSYRYWLIAPIPRLLWPGKPNISATGAEFNGRATGNMYSASSPGLFAEAYWNFGWMGVWLIMPILGVVLYALGRYGQWVLETGQWWHLPIALLAMRVGLRSDGMFVVDVVGAISTILVLHLVVSAGLAVLSGTGRLNSSGPTRR